jgi:D-amino-acid dehydrogenase
MRVIVVGGGILGASAAYHLARAGAEVVLADAAHEGRATAAGAGIVCPWANDDGGLWYSFYGEGAKFYPRVIAALAEDGETDTGYARVGGLVVDADASLLDDLATRIAGRAAERPEAGAVTRLAPAEARGHFPPLHPEFGGVHIAGGARVDGRLMAAALRRAAAKRGVTERAGLATLVAEGGRVRGIRIGEERIEADAVIVTAGAWARELLAPLGLALDVAPQRGQITHLRVRTGDTGAWPVILPTGSHYLLSFPDQRVVVGATRETGAGFDYRVTAAGQAEVLNNALAVAPGLADATLIETRIGFRPAAGAMRPLLGGVPGIEGLVIGNGLGAAGLTMGPFAGFLLSELVLGRAPEHPLDPFRPFG